MRNLQRFCASLSLALALSIPAMAGDIQTGSPVVPPKPTPQSLVFDTSEGDILSTTSVDPLAELTLALLNGVLSIF